VPRNDFYVILVTATSGRPTPEICFLPRQLRWTLLPKERCGDLRSVSVLKKPWFQNKHWGTLI